MIIVGPHNVHTQGQRHHPKTSPPNLIGFGGDVYLRRFGRLLSV